MKLILHVGAEADMLEAFNWYEDRRAGLGDEFLEELNRAFDRITETPEAFPKTYRELRRLIVHRFPYAMYFLETDDVVRVYGVLHGRRDRRILRRRSFAP